MELVQKEEVLKLKLQPHTAGKSDAIQVGRYQKMTLNFHSMSHFSASLGSFQADLKCKRKG